MASAYSWASSSLLLALLLGLVACRPNIKKVIIGRIVVDAPRELDDAHLARSALREAVAHRLEDDGSVTLQPDGRSASHILQLVLSEPTSPVDGPSTRTVEVHLRPLGEAADFVASAQTASHDSLLVTALEGFDAAWKHMRQLRELDVAKDEALLQALHDSEPRVREFAIQRVGERRLKAAVEPLCVALDNEAEPTLVLKIIGALVAIHDRRAVEPLIELARQKDAGFVLQVVFAVGALGGRTAEGYLVTMAGGHPDEEVRRGAQDALEELKSKRRAP